MDVCVSLAVFWSIGFCSRADVVRNGADFPGLLGGKTSSRCPVFTVRLFLAG